MAPANQYEHPFYNIAQNVFGGRERDEALLQHQYNQKLERDRQLLRMKQDEADRVADLEAQRLGTAMGRMAPSTTVTNPDQPGPVLQEPSIDIPGVTSPLPPPSMADTFFPGPSRATFGNEALYPQAGPSEPPTYPIKQPGQEWRDVYSPAWAAGLPEVPPPPVRPEPPETVGGATVAEPEVPQRPLPYTAAPFRPGGTREEVPGMGLDQLLREQPSVGRAYLQNRKGLEEVESADVEARGRKATRAYIAARKGGTSEKDAYDLYGEEMEASKYGQNFLTSIGARETKELEQETKRRTLEKETKAQEWLKTEAARLRSQPNASPADLAKADLFDTYALDPKLAERLEAHEKTKVEQEANRLKQEELKKKPMEIGGVGYRWAKNAAGEDVMEVIPGQRIKPEKSKWEGITPTELDTMIANPATSPEDRQIATDAIARVQARSEKTAAAGQLKWAPGEIEEMQNTLATAHTYFRIAKLVRENPSGWGGPGGIFAKWDKFVAKFNMSTEERIKARNDIEQSASMLRKAIFGTALSAHEAKFATWLPTGTEESVMELVAKLEATGENIRRALQYKVYLKNGGDPTKLPLMATPEGDVDLDTATAKPGPHAAPRSAPLPPNQQNLIDRHKGTTNVAPVPTR